MNEPQYTIAYESLQGITYLCGLETHCYGDRILGYFGLYRSCAMPLTQEQANVLLPLLKKELPPHDAAKPLVHLQIVPVPWARPESEVPGNE